MTTLSAYPPGVTGAEPQITGSAPGPGGVGVVCRECREMFDADAIDFWQITRYEDEWTCPDPECEALNTVDWRDDG